MLTRCLIATMWCACRQEPCKHSMTCTAHHSVCMLAAGQVCLHLLSATAQLSVLAVARQHAQHPTWPPLHVLAAGADGLSCDAFVCRCFSWCNQLHLLPVRQETHDQPRASGLVLSGLCHALGSVAHYLILSWTCVHQSTSPAFIKNARTGPGTEFLTSTQLSLPHLPSSLPHTNTPLRPPQASQRAWTSTPHTWHRASASCPCGGCCRAVLGGL